MSIYIKPRVECSEQELADFVRLASEDTCRQTIYTARVQLIAFAYEGDELISTRCLKAPFLSYKVALFKQAQMEEYHRLYSLESGYSYTVPHFRKNGLSTMLLKSLMDYEPYRHLKVFATTLMHNTPIVKVMLKLRAKPIGRPFATPNGMVLVWRLR